MDLQVGIQIFMSRRTVGSDKTFLGSRFGWFGSGVHLRRKMDSDNNNNNNKLYALHVVLGRLASPGSPAWLCSVGMDPVLRFDM